MLIVRFELLTINKYVWDALQESNAVYCIRRFGEEAIQIV